MTDTLKATTLLPAFVPLAGVSKTALQMVIASQIRLTDMLKATAIQAQDIHGLLQLRTNTTSLDSSTIRIDLAPYQYVHWLNDLEKVRTRLHSLHPLPACFNWCCPLLPAYIVHCGLCCMPPPQWLVHACKCMHGQLPHNHADRNPNVAVLSVMKAKLEV